LSSAEHLAPASDSWYWGSVEIIGWFVPTSSTLVIGSCWPDSARSLQQLWRNPPYVIGEVTDASNHAVAFEYLPIFSWLGSVVGLLIGGLLSPSPSDSQSLDNGYFERLPCTLVD
jgi:hypothetical protein